MRPRPASRPVPLLILVSAPSGAGKTTLCRHLLDADPTLTRAVTCTTRPPRPGERNGADYHFLDERSFAAGVRAGKFLEHARVYGHRYGTWRAEVLNRLRHGRNVLLNVDVQGARTLRSWARREPRLGRALVSVFLCPASLSVLEARLRGRATESTASLRRRLRQARRELAHWRRFDYLLTSTTIEEDLRRMRTLLEAERMRACRAAGPDDARRTSRAHRPPPATRRFP